MVVKRITENLAELKLTVRQVWGIVATVCVIASGAAVTVHVLRSDLGHLEAKVTESADAIRRLTDTMQGLDRRVAVVESGADTRDAVEVRLRALEIQQGSIVTLLEAIRQDLRDLKRGGG